jgi:hypothetical protein
VFESNFSVDRLSLSYVAHYGGLKRSLEIETRAASLSDSEQKARFAGIAARVYSITI